MTIEPNLISCKRVAISWLAPRRHCPWPKETKRKRRRETVTKGKRQSERASEGEREREIEREREGGREGEKM